MSHNIVMIVTTTAHGSVLYADAEGAFDIESAKQTFLQIVDAIKEHGSEKVLFDGQKITGEPTIIERFYYGEFVANAVAALHRYVEVGINPRFAYFMAPPVLDPSRLGETVAANRGMIVKAFDTLPAALKWLDVSFDE